jgi:predicted ABC-type ATPase
MDANDENNKSAPFLIVVAGPNGSGKTTITNALRRNSFDLGEYINPDDITQELLSLKENPTKKDIHTANQEAQGISEERRRAALAEGRSLSFETVMSHPNKLDFIREAKDKGYEVKLYFVGTDDPAINVDRVAQRVKEGGHDVPVDKIVSRYDRVMALLPEAVKSSDQARIYDNSKVEDPHRLIAAIENGKTVIFLADPPHWVKDRLLDKLGHDKLERGPYKEKADDFRNLPTKELMEKYPDDKAILNAIAIRGISESFANKKFPNSEDRQKFVENALNRLTYNIEHGRENSSPLIKSTKAQDNDLER